MKGLENTDFESFSFFDMTPDLVCIANKEGFFVKINKAVTEKLEYTQAELFSRPIFTNIHPEDREITARTRAQMLEGEALVNFQNRYITKSGKTVWLHWTSIYIPDKEYVFALAKDVTERKMEEKAIEEKFIKFKHLATHFKSKIEKDRMYFAVELHEELAQLAAVIKMDIDWLSNNIPNPTGIMKQRLDNSLVVSRMLIETIRRVAFSVSPGILDDLGLDETLKWLCKEFSNLNNIPCSYTSNSDGSMLSHEAKLDFFRICQEALLNVMQHSEARSVTIQLDEDDSRTKLTITDDGKGFDQASNHMASGLVTMSELAFTINADFNVTSSPGNGTRVELIYTPDIITANHHSISHL